MKHSATPKTREIGSPGDSLFRFEFWATSQRPLPSVKARGSSGLRTEETPPALRSVQIAIVVLPTKAFSSFLG
jgi:hypothetical protein